MPIKDIHPIEQPREKLIKYGPGKLSNAELLAVLLRTGSKKIGVMSLSRKVLSLFKDGKLTHASYEELKSGTQIGSVQSCQVVACFELGRRLLLDRASSIILSPRGVWDELKHIRESKKEQLVIFFLDTQNQVIKQELISIGTLNSSLVHPREVFEPAVRYSASHIIIAHNHPSGSLEPSPEDIAATKRLKDSGHVLGIEIIDHVIVTKEGWSSMKEKNLLT